MCQVQDEHLTQSHSWDLQVGLNQSSCLKFGFSHAFLSLPQPWRSFGALQNITKEFFPLKKASGKDFLQHGLGEASPLRWLTRDIPDNGCNAEVTISAFIPWTLLGSPCSWEGVRSVPPAVAFRSQEANQPQTNQSKADSSFFQSQPCLEPLRWSSFLPRHREI